MNKIAIDKNKCSMDVNSYGDFCQRVKLDLSPELNKEITDAIKKSGIFTPYSLDNAEFFFVGTQEVNKQDKVFNNTYIDVLTSHGSYLPVNKINTLPEITALCKDAQPVVIEALGEDVIRKNFGIDSKVKTVCEIAEYVLDRDTNKEKVISFWDVENDTYGNYAATLELSLDEDFDNTYQIKVISYCDGEQGEGFINDIEGIEQLEQALYGIANGTCEVIAKEFSDKPITCAELAVRTVKKFNEKQEKAYSETKEG